MSGPVLDQGQEKLPPGNGGLLTRGRMCSWPTCGGASGYPVGTRLTVDGKMAFLAVTQGDLASAP